MLASKKRKRPEDADDNIRDEVDSRYWFQQLLLASKSYDLFQTQQLINFGIPASLDDSKVFFISLLGQETLSSNYEACLFNRQIIQSWMKRPGMDKHDKIRGEMLMIWISHEPNTPRLLRQFVSNIFDHKPNQIPITHIMPERLFYIMTPDQIFRAGKGLRMFVSYETIYNQWIKPQIFRSDERSFAAIKAWIHHRRYIPKYKIRILLKLVSHSPEFWKIKAGHVLFAWPKLKWVNVPWHSIEEPLLFSFLINNLVNTSPDIGSFSEARIHDRRIQIQNGLRQVPIMDKLLLLAGFPARYKFSPDVLRLIGSYIM